MPVVDSIEELNALLAAADDADDARRISNRANSVGHDGAFEKTLLRPLPAEPFDTALTLAPHEQVGSANCWVGLAAKS
jgi:hypothetical protein